MILDTNALSAMADGQTGAVAQSAKAQRIAVPVIVLGEYRFGIAHSRRKAEYERWLTEILAGSSVLEITEDTAWHYAEIRTELRRAGTQIPANDAWIAALSRQHTLSVLSRDEHFDLVAGVRRIGW